MHLGTWMMHRYPYCSSMTFSFKSLQERMMKQNLCPIPTNMLFPDDEDVVVHLVHSPLNDIVSLHNLEVASSPCVSSELGSHSRVKPELSCWPEASFARGHGAVIPDWNTLGCILQMTYQGQLGIKCCLQRMMLMTFRIIKLEFLKKQVCFHTKVDRRKVRTGYCSFY